MLYNWLEAQRALMRTALAWSNSVGHLWGAPAAGDEPLPVPGCDWLRRFFQVAPGPPPFGIDAVTIAGRRIPVDESVVDQTPFCDLRRFSRRGETAPMAGGAILLCAPLAGHHAVMLRETVETLLEDADVYVTDWADARDVPLAAGRFGLDDYVLTVERFLLRLSELALHVVAVCQATAAVVAAAALAAAPGRGGRAPLSLTLMGGPIDTRFHPTVIGKVAAAHSIEWFRETVIDTVPAGYSGAGRRIYPGYLQHAALVAAYPHRQLALESRYWESWLRSDAAQLAASLQALNEYAAVLDMTEDYFVDTLRVVFKEQHLAYGRWNVDGRRVRPRALNTTPLCTVEGDRDDITGAGQTHAAHALFNAAPGSLGVRLTIDDCDHYDLFTGPRWRKAVHPNLARFWRAANAYGATQVSNT